jgi:hypothetical protein
MGGLDIRIFKNLPPMDGQGSGWVKNETADVTVGSKSRAILQSVLLRHP